MTMTVTCGVKSVSLEIQRPSFESVQRAYEKINLLSREQISQARETVKKILMDKGISEEDAEKMIGNSRYDVIAARYMKVGGGAYRQFLNDMDKYYNTCTLRVSYALNYSSIPINKMKHQISGRAYKGDDGHTYYLGVLDMIELLKSNWKELSWNKRTYNQVKENINKGCSEDFYKAMDSKKENQEFFKELQTINRKGIVAMTGENHFHHATLWDGRDFVDVRLVRSDNYLVLEGYLVKELYFWDLK